MRARDGDTLEVLAHGLRWDGARLVLGELEPRHVRWRDEGLAFVDCPQPGDLVSLHWDFVCDVISSRAARRLQRVTEHCLGLVNGTSTAAAVGC